MKLQNTSKSNKMLTYVTVLLVLIAAAVLIVSCQDADSNDATASGNGSGEVAGSTADLNAIAEARGLTPADMAAALKTYTPSGQHDPYIMFASGGHSGQMFVIGVPSMRMMKHHCRLYAGTVAGLWLWRIELDAAYWLKVTRKAPT